MVKLDLDDNMENTQIAEHRKLASIQSVIDVQPIEGADKIERLSVLGYYCVARKNEFKIGDKVVFVEPDAILPFAPWSEFLRDKNKPDKPIRIRTISLKKQVSQGVCFPTSILTKELMYDENEKAKAWVTRGIDLGGHYVEGTDVTEWLGITQYIPYIPANLVGKVKGLFPSFLRKTDSLRIQSYPDVINELKQDKVYGTIKVDGTSVSLYHKDGVFGVCSRNLELLDDGSVFWEMAKKYDLPTKLMAYGKNFCIQSECYGNGVQGNKLGIPDKKLAVFDIFDIDNRKYLCYNELLDVCNELGLETVKFIYHGDFIWNSVDEVIQFASTLKYDNGTPAEGVVFRPTNERYSQVLGERLATKAINPVFLLKYHE